jgi:hypothetical protein
MVFVKIMGRFVDGYALFVISYPDFNQLRAFLKGLCSTRFMYITLTIYGAKKISFTSYKAYFSRQCPGPLFFFGPIILTTQFLYR